MTALRELSVVEYYLDILLLSLIHIFDVAFALGYAKPRNAINVHCKGALKRGVLTSGGRCV